LVLEPFDILLYSPPLFFPLVTPLLPFLFVRKSGQYVEFFGIVVSDGIFVSHGEP
jgi:hypothetical protein